MRKTFTPHDLKLDEAGHIVLAFAQMNVVDADRDVSLPGSFPTKAVPMSAYGHSSWDGALPTGKGAIREAGEWAVFEGDFFLDTDQGRNTYNTVKAMGELQEYSYGLKPLRHSYGQKDGISVRFIEKQDVFEVSPVLKGAGVSTHTMAIKSGGPGPDTPYADHAAWVLGVVKAFSDRTTDRSEWRAKEGRSLSVANREALAEIVKGLGLSMGELQKLLDDTDPRKGLRTELDVLLAQARGLGVPVPA
jgi:hypothetical protein